MLITTETPSGNNLHIIVPKSTEKRLRTTCFRQRKKLAGNFSQWMTTRQVLLDPDVSYHLSDYIDELLKLKEKNNENITNNSLCIDLETPIGWTSTNKLNKFAADSLEQFWLNNKCEGLRVKKDAKILAPKTNLLTIVFELKSKGKATTVIVKSIYPGDDVGELLPGNISFQECCAFFDFDNPGEP